MRARCYTGKSLRNLGLSMSAQGQAVRLREAVTEEDVTTARRLFEEYAEWLGVDLSFQSFDEELASLPAPYIRPGGFILLAECEGVVAGCVGLRKIDGGIGEIKRLLCGVEYRGHGIGRRLIKHVVTEANQIGYLRLRLDRLPVMKAARCLYEA